MIQGVFFDLYGTLLVYGNMRAAWHDWMASFFRSFRSFGLQRTEQEFSDRCKGFFSRPEPSGAPEEFTVLERRVWAFGIDQGLALDSTQIRSTALSFLEAWHEQITLDPQALPVLEALRRGRKTALVSNFDHPPHVHGLLSKTGLLRRFDAVVVSGDVGCSKPDPAIFEVALRRTGIAPHEAVHVGDAIEDIRGAQAAGIMPILIRRTRPEDDPVVADFGEIEERGVTGPGLGDEPRMIAALPELLDLV